MQELNEVEVENVSGGILALLAFALGVYNGWKDTQAATK